MYNNFTRKYNPVAELFGGAVCAECQYCCFFSEADIWELPVISGDIARILEGKPGLVTYSYHDGKRFFMPVYDAEHLFRCPALGDNGCVLGTERPLDCRLYPFRIVRAASRGGERSGERFLAIAKDCRSSIDGAELAEFVREKNLFREMLQLADSGEINVVDYYEKYYSIID